MRISKINQLILVSTAIITTSHAAVITNTVITDLPGATNPGYDVARPLGVSISGDNAVYLVGTMTLTTTVGSLGSSYMEANMGLGTVFNSGFGNGFGGDSIVITSNGSQATATQTFTQSVPVAFVLKLNQTNGVSTLWVNPNLSSTEALNTVSATATILAVNGSTFDSVIFRGGDFDVDTRVVDYTGFSVHYGGDTPFSAIPEPSSALLLSLAGLAIGRRRR